LNTCIWNIGILLIFIFVSSFSSFFVCEYQELYFNAHGSVVNTYFSSKKKPDPDKIKKYETSQLYGGFLFQNLNLLEMGLIK